MNAEALFFQHEVNNAREAIVANVRTNAARALPELKQHAASARPLMIVAGGPSVRARLPIIRAMRADCDVMAVNGAYGFLREHGIDPEHFVLIDSRAANVGHVQAPSERTNHVLASQVHPDVFDALRDYRVTVVHLGTETSIETLKGQDKDFLTAPIGMASVHAVYIAAALGYRTLMLFGYDFSHQEQATYAFDQPMNRSDEAIEVTIGEHKFQTTITLARTAEQFVRAISPVIRGCELDVQVHSEGLLPTLLRYSEEQARRPAEDREREKYERMWNVEAYRRVSPGLEEVGEAFKALKMPLFKHVIGDFGCGTGRAAAEFRRLGLDVVGVDIAGNALEEDIPFVQAALWDAEKLPRVDYGFSVDVLEHIPTDKVDDTLRAIHGACAVACYLNIDTIPDAFGVVIGQTLHLTVQPGEWWEEKLRALWPTVERIRPDDPRQAIFVCRK